MIHEVTAVGPLQCNCSIIGDETTHEAMVIDPGDEVENLLRRIAALELTVTAIVVTHGHIDHIGGAAKLKAATGAPIYMNVADQQQIQLLDLQAAWIGVESPGKVAIDQPLRDLDKLTIGGLNATVLHTPGHTEGSSCVYFPAEMRLVAGDTLFAGSVGRTDLPGGNFEKLMSSLHGKLMELPDDVLVVPGHGQRTTIGEERESNPFITDKRYKPKVQEG
jgi:hydroxyacylglutathione hydrolase